MKPKEAFALHVRSRFMDMANNCSGILRCWADDIAQGKREPAEIQSFLERQAEDLQKKLRMVMEEISSFVGGDDKLRTLLREDFDSGWVQSSPSLGIWAKQPLDKKES